MTVQEVTAFFCRKKNVPPEVLGHRRRNPDVWCCQYMIWHYMHYSMGMSLTNISRSVGRNRPSVARGIRILKHHMRYHKEVRDEFRAIVKEIEGAAIATPSEDMMEEKN